MVDCQVVLGHLSGLAFYEDLNTLVKVAEATALRDLVRKEVTSIRPGTTVELCGGFRRQDFFFQHCICKGKGKFTLLDTMLPFFAITKNVSICSFRGKTTGHDIDLLISHPEDGCEKGLLLQLMQRLDRLGLVLFGSITNSTFTEAVLRTPARSNLTSTLDHFEKWIGILKLNKALFDSQPEQAKREHSTDCDDVVPPSCRGNIPRSTSQLRSAPDSVDAAKPRFERTASLTAAFDQSKSDRDWIARRVDLIICSASQYYYALVGWTGNKHFNRYGKTQNSVRRNLEFSVDETTDSFCNFLVLLRNVSCG